MENIINAVFILTLSNCVKWYLDGYSTKDTGIVFIKKHFKITKILEL